MPISSTMCSDASSQITLSQQFLAALDEGPLALIVSRQRDGAFLEVNQTFCRMSAYSRDELIGKTAIELGILDSKTGRERIQQAPLLPDGSSAKIELALRTKAGEQRFLSASVNSIRYQDEDCFLTFALDITEREKTDAALRLSEERFRCLFNSSVMGLVVADMGGTIIDANDSYLSLIGCTREELIAGSIRWDRITPPEWIDADQQALAALRTSGVCQSLEKEYLRPDGSRVAVLGVAAMLPGPHEQAMCMFVDITERKAVESELNRYRHQLEEMVALRTAELRESQQRLGLALEASAIGLWDTNLSTGDVFYDERWCSMLGYGRTEIPPVQASWQTRVHPEDWPSVESAVNAHLAGETARYISEHRLKHKDGHWVWVLAKGKIVERDAQGSPLRVIGTHLDISHQKRLSLDGVQLLKQIESLIQIAGSSSIEHPSRPKSSRKTESDVLSRRQRQLLELIAKGYSSAEIAERLKIAPTTAVSHRRELMRKLDLHSVADLTRYAIAQGLISD